MARKVPRPRSAPTPRPHAAPRRQVEAAPRAPGRSARLAVVELLYDQPYEDKQRVRVTGPFTVPGDFLGDGSVKRAAICVGPQYGTVGPGLVREAAKGGLPGRGVRPPARLRLRVRPARHRRGEAPRRPHGPPTLMNPDLPLGEELLRGPAPGTSSWSLASRTSRLGGESRGCRKCGCTTFGTCTRACSWAKGCR